MVSGDLILAYVLGIITPVFISWISDSLGRRQGYLSERIDEICSAIIEQADRACSYWQQPGQAGTGSRTSGLVAEEAKMAACDFYIGAMIAYLADEFGKMATHLEDGAVFEFSDAVTGGNFQVIGRTSEPVRCDRIQRAGYALCVALRKARRDAIFPPRFLMK